MYVLSMIYETLRLGMKNENVVILQRILVRNGYENVPLHGTYDEDTEAAVAVFQAQHQDQDGKPLIADGVAGRKTLWAVENATGDAQRSWRGPQNPAGITPQRAALLSLLDREYDKDVHENPDGSNRSPEIDRYFEGTGMIGLAWCCVFVSWALRHFAVFSKFLSVWTMWEAARLRPWTTKSPKPGDVFVQLFSKRKGHTGFVIGVSEDDEWIYTCEGNCGNRLKRGKRHVSTIQGFIDVLNDGQDMSFGRSSDHFVERIDGNTR